jgi:hypothetical protein
VSERPIHGPFPLSKSKSDRSSNRNGDSHARNQNRIDRPIARAIYFNLYIVRTRGRPRCTEMRVPSGARGGAREFGAGCMFRVPAELRFECGCR